MTPGFRVDRQLLRLPIDIRHGQRPERSQIDARDQLAQKRGEKLPMPTQKRAQNPGHADVDDVIGGGCGALHDKREYDHLQNVCDDRHKQRRPHPRPRGDSNRIGILNHRDPAIQVLSPRSGEEDNFGERARCLFDACCEAGSSQVFHSPRSRLASS